MAVHFDTDNNNNLYPATEIKREPVTVPVNKKDLKDFFPRTEKNFLGFFRQMDFKNKLQRNISEVYELMKSSWLEANENKEQDGDKTSQKLIAFQRANYWERFDIELKNRILHRLQNEDWRTYEKLNMADQMYEESSSYFKAAGKELALFGVGQGVSKLGRIAKSGKKLKGSIFQRDTGAMGVHMNRQWRKEIVFRRSGRKQMIHVMDADLVNTNIAVWDNNYSYLNNDSDSVNCMEAFGAAGVVAGFNPYIGIASTIVNVGFNTALGYKYREIADRMQNLENKSNEKDNDFNSQITNSICEDFKALDFDEIHNLIKYLGIE